MLAKHFLLGLSLAEPLVLQLLLRSLLVAKPAVARAVERIEPGLRFGDLGLRGREGCGASLQIVSSIADILQSCKGLLRGLGLLALVGQDPVQFLGLILQGAQGVRLGRLSDLVLRGFDPAMGPDESVVIEAVLHDGPAGPVELVERVGETDRAIAAHDERHRVRILAPENGRESAAFRLGPELLELVQAHQGCVAELAAAFLENRRGSADVRSVHEYGLPVAAEERLGGSRPFGFGAPGA
ncbi:hypothetical protein [Bradyrhizobium arachidis]|uniref:hypothetical protein n=1 Tax=Bradyrhizobium arachidis TaxID=858423 RepID=UPI0021622819|nr:hypothetical protein [Bradyrhizobium arachidis]